MEKLSFVIIHIDKISYYGKFRLFNLFIYSIEQLKFLFIYYEFEQP